MQTRIVADANFNNAVRAQFELAHQLDADRAARRGEPHFVEQLTPDQPEIAIDIAQPYAKNQPRETIVDRSDDDAMPGIAPLELISVDQPHIGRELRQDFGISAVSYWPSPSV